jgi:hypothetical protein
MPAIQDIQSWVEVKSELPLDCTTAQEQFAKTNSNFVAGVPSSGDDHIFSCKSFAKKPLSTGAKIGIALGVVVFVKVLVIVAVVLLKKRKVKKDVPTVIPLEDRELDQRASHGERPPPYAESIVSDIGPLAEPKSAV